MSKKYSKKLKYHETALEQQFTYLEDAKNEKKIDNFDPKKSNKQNFPLKDFNIGKH